MDATRWNTDGQRDHQYGPQTQPYPGAAGSSIVGEQPEEHAVGFAATMSPEVHLQRSFGSDVFTRRIDRADPEFTSTPPAVSTEHQPSISPSPSQSPTVSSPSPSQSPTVRLVASKLEGRGLVSGGMGLDAIGITLVGGLCVSFLTVLAFGLAVLAHHPTIAPRCTARHPNTIWRSRRDIYGASKSREEDSDSPQIPETNVVSDSQTRQDGEVPLNGPPSSTRGAEPLKSILKKENDSGPNVEGNTQMSYGHPQDRGNPFLGWIPWALRLSYPQMLKGVPGTGTRKKGMGGSMLSVNLDAIVLFRFHALCLRVTAVACFICIGLILPMNLTACEEPQCPNDLTNYGRTTIANVGYGIMSIRADSDIDRPNIFSTIFWTNGTEQNFPHMLRLYAISFCSWYITYFALKNIKRDWRENLVLRRVYYLEGDHHGNRQAELAETVYRPSVEETEDESEPEEERAFKNRPANSYKDRDPWIPHPEQRDTVPCIELYSVLVGGLPSLPDEVVNRKDLEVALFSNRANIDWQLDVATTFFDHCVPNQPGFSSSVVAVTILPGAPELAKAWRKWYAAARTLRRLRFIRRLIREKVDYAIDDVNEESGAESSPSTAVGVTQLDTQYTCRDQMPQPYPTADHEPALDTPNAQAAEDHSQVNYSSVFSELDYGPEQQAVYSREIANTAATCCVNGICCACCCEGRVRRQTIDRLRELEVETTIQLEKAYKHLQCAQEQAAVSVLDDVAKSARKQPRQAGLTEPVSPHPSIVTEPSGTPRLNAVGEETIVPNSLRPINVPPRTPVMIVNDEVSLAASSSNSENNADHIFRGGEFNVTTNSIHEDQEFGSNNIHKSVHYLKSPNHPSSRKAISRMNSEARYEDEIASEASRVPSVERSLRRRSNAALSAVSEGDASMSSNQWGRVNTILGMPDPEDYQGSNRSNKREMESGVWTMPSTKPLCREIISGIVSRLRAVGRWTRDTADPLTSKLAKDSTYAVVTFSSRQAAVAARHCLADGRGAQRWLSEETVPIPPLADAAPCDILTCRGCCRPLTLNINHNQFMIRRYLALGSLASIYIFYTLPLSYAQRLVAPQFLQENLPGLWRWIDESEFLSAEIMAGLVSALLYTSFFALCPIMFKAIANSGSRATSLQEAEKYALKYFWYFMLVTAFVFTGLTEAAISIYKYSDVQATVEELIHNIAAQTPLVTAATWLNWIIVRTTMTLPLQYLLQVNSFLFGCIGWGCCERCVIGGGPGAPIPYRIYVDGGVVFLCVVALAPQSPLVAPFALLYYLVCVPLWRRNCIFTYRPKFNSGGELWPFLSDILITSLFMGQLLLALQMTLKKSYGPALIAAFPCVPTALTRNYLIKRFKRAYEDAGLLQTSLLDGWDNTIPTSVERREEFRKFLVDAHKAAYIPVCIAGGAANILTAEPAYVIPSDNDDMLGYADTCKNGLSTVFGDQECISPSANVSMNGIGRAPTPTQTNQHGICMRRVFSFAQPSPSTTRSPEIS